MCHIVDNVFIIPELGKQPDVWIGFNHFYFWKLRGTNSGYSMILKNDSNSGSVGNY